jgi:hypothetical protein
LNSENYLFIEVLVELVIGQVVVNVRDEKPFDLELTLLLVVLLAHHFNELLQIGRTQIKSSIYVFQPRRHQALISLFTLVIHALQLRDHRRNQLIPRRQVGNGFSILITCIIVPKQIFKSKLHPKGARQYLVTFVRHCLPSSIDAFLQIRDLFLGVDFDVVAVLFESGIVVEREEIVC